MRQLIGLLLSAFWWIYTIYSFSMSWGIIGAFISIFAAPIAMVWMAVASLLAGGADLVITVFWIGSIFWLIKE